MTLLVASVLVTLLISALCSLMEATLLSLTPSQVADLARKRPRAGAIWTRFKADIERPIAVILILNTAAHTMGASIAGSQFDALFGDDWIWLFGLGFTYLMLQFTEILPKTVGVQRNRSLAPIIGRPLSIGITVLRPVTWLIHAINRPFEGRGGERKPKALEEVTAMAGLARIGREITHHQERIIRGASRLSGMSAAQVMVPMEHVSALSVPQSLSDALVAARVDLHTRYPAFADGDWNRVRGYVNFKEIVSSLKTNPQDASLEGIIRPVQFVNADAPAPELLRTFVDERVHMAIVRDSAGRTLGLVTLEDLVEELVGELEDEFDRLPRHVHGMSGGAWLVGGGVPMREASKRTGLDLPRESLSIADWLSKRMDEPLTTDSTCVVSGVRFSVRRIRRGKAFEVAITKAQS